MTATSATGDRSIPRRAWRAAAGFTLIELMVALAIMVLIAAAVPMALGRLMPGRRVAVAADQLTADLQWLQGEALRAQAPASLTLQPRGYSLDVQSDRRVVSLPSTTRLQVRAQADARELERLLIFPDGTASPSRILISDSGRQIELQVSMLTGRVSRL